MKKLVLVSIIALVQISIFGCAKNSKSISKSNPAPTTDITNPSPSESLPLLKQIVLHESLAIYQDSQNISRYYYFPDTLGFAQAENGRPLFSLISIQDSASKDVYFLSMSLRLKSSSTQSSNLKKWQADNPRKTLEVLPARSLGLKNQHLDFFLEQNIARAPGTLESEMGLNGLLTLAGFQKYKEAAINGKGSVGLFSCYEFKGIDENKIIKDQEFCLDLNFSEIGPRNRDLISEE